MPKVHQPLLKRTSPTRFRERKCIEKDGLRSKPENEDVDSRISDFISCADLDLLEPLRSSRYDSPLSALARQTPPANVECSQTVRGALKHREYRRLPILYGPR